LAGDFLGIDSAGVNPCGGVGGGSERARGNSPREHRQRGSSGDGVRLWQRRRSSVIARGKGDKREPPGAPALGGSCQLAGRVGSLRIERLRECSIHRAHLSILGESQDVANAYLKARFGEPSLRERKGAIRSDPAGLVGAKGSDKERSCRVGGSERER
jgi:hypothetical protein